MKRTISDQGLSGPGGKSRDRLYIYNFEEGQTAFIPILRIWKSWEQKERGFSSGENPWEAGKVKIVRLNNISVDFTGEYSTLIVSQTDKPGVVAHITKVLSEAGVNIAFMRLFREENRSGCLYGGGI